MPNETVNFPLLTSKAGQCHPDTDFGEIGRQLAGVRRRAFPMFSGVFANLFDKKFFSVRIRPTSIQEVTAQFAETCNQQAHSLTPAERSDGAEL